MLHTVLWVIIALVLILWLLGFIFRLGRGFIHLLLIVAVVIIICKLSAVNTFHAFKLFGGYNMKLETSRLGQSDLHITRVGIGTAPIGSIPSWRIYWGPQDESEAIRAIEAALDLGVNWIDTAPFYGWGRGEQIVGKALRGKRDRVYIFTKCGTLQDGQGGEREDLTPASIRRENPQPGARFCGLD